MSLKLNTVTGGKSINNINETNTNISLKKLYRNRFVAQMYCYNYINYIN